MKLFCDIGDAGIKSFSPFKWTQDLVEMEFAISFGGTYNLVCGRPKVHIEFRYHVELRIYPLLKLKCPFLNFKGNIILMLM